MARKLDTLLCKDTGYNERFKKEYEFEGKKFLRRLNIALNKICGSSKSKITCNEGGAVAGDIALWTTLGNECIVNIQLITEYHKGIMFREVFSYEDYVGGPNNLIRLTDMKRMSYEQIAQYIVKNTLYKLDMCDMTI